MCGEVSVAGCDYEPLVSVIIPAFNSEATIKGLLDSLMALDYRRDRLEIILVDGGSTDRTREIAQEYPIKVIVEERRGINVARNFGVRNSNGEILAFTDSDCIVPVDWIRKIVEAFKDSRVGCLGGSVIRYEDNFLSRYADESIMPVLRRFRRRELLGDVGLMFRYPAGCNMAFRREALERVGYFDERIRYGFDEDELIERICRSGYLMLLDPEIVVWHRHRGSLRGLLKQVFNYGRGGGLIVRIGIRGKFSRWILMSLISFLFWIMLCVSLAASAIFFSRLFLIPLLSVTVAPLMVLLGFYMFKASSWGWRRWTEALAYPILDLLRILCFNMGIIRGLLTTGDS